MSSDIGYLLKKNAFLIEVSGLEVSFHSVKVILRHENVTFSIFNVFVQLDEPCTVQYRKRSFTDI